jgi:exonuclease VII small subunit
MAELFVRTGDADLDDALALLEQAHSAIDRAASHFAETKQLEVVGALNTALNALYAVDEMIR